MKNARQLLAQIINPLRIGTCLHYRLSRMWTAEDNACQSEDEVVTRADSVLFFETQSLCVQKGKLIMDRLHELPGGRFFNLVWADMARLSIADFSSFRRLSMNWRSISESSVLSNRR
jgi:hypothetical protein